MLSDSHWSDFCRALGVQAPAEMATLKGRQLHRAEAEELVERAVGERDFDDISARLQSAGCSFAEVMQSANVLDNEHARHEGKTYPVRIGNAEYAMPALPMRSGSAGAVPGGEVPRLGQHTMELLESLEYSASDRAALVEGGAVFATG